MTLTIELTAELLVALEKQAEARGVSKERLARLVLTEALTLPADESGEPSSLRTDRGILAKYGKAPSAEEIEASSAEMLHGLALQP